MPDANKADNMNSLPRRKPSRIQRMLRRALLLAVCIGVLGALSAFALHRYRVAKANPLLDVDPYISAHMETGGSVPRLPDGKPDLQGTWLERTADGSMPMYSIERTPGRPQAEIPAGDGVIVDPPDGLIPYQPWARQKQIDLEENHMLEQSDAHCYVGGVPHMMFAPFGMRILQPPGYVVMTWEYMHGYRIIPLNAGPPVDSGVKLWEGDSRGRWEHDTLVVDVRNQVGRTWLDQSANFHSDSIHVTERIQALDSNNLQYEARIEDPKVYTQPWTIRFYYSRVLDPSQEQMEYACFEGEKDVSRRRSTFDPNPVSQGK